MNNNNLNVFQNHDLIKRSQTYVLDRKLITFHSNDRDIKKWPFANHFEIELPETLNNIQSMRVVQTCFPMIFYTFSNEYQNTKMTFRMIPTPRETIDDIVYIILSQSLNHDFTIEIQEGTYSAQQLCLELQRKMNKSVYDYLISKSLTPSEASYEYFYVEYDEVAQKIWFGNSLDNYSLEFGKKENYDLVGECKQPNVWEQYTHWGLPYYIGYEKRQYIGFELNEPITFDYKQDPLWFQGINNNVYVVEATFIHCLNNNNVMYMEIDKFNSMDEIVPYSNATSNMYNNDYNGTVNAAFEKIPLNINGDQEIFNSRNDYLQNVSHYEVPIETIRKLKFSFRFHDGRYVDFQDCDFNFTMSFNCIKDEIPKAYELRIPAAYTL
jgi:hypothetical protein